MLTPLTGGKSTVFAIGTPVSNSMVERYTMKRYLQYDTLREKTCSILMLGRVPLGKQSHRTSLHPEGKGYRPRTRFSRFFNLPELMSMFKEVTDIKTADELDLPTPRLLISKKTRLVLCEYC